jgi:hypothetical protein
MTVRAIRQIVADDGRTYVLAGTRGAVTQVVEGPQLRVTWDWAVHQQTTYSQFTCIVNLTDVAAGE